MIEIPDLGKKRFKHSLRSQAVFKQKLDYIHANPVVAGLCRFPKEYKYSSAAFYDKGTSEWNFITPYNA